MKKLIIIFVTFFLFISLCFYSYAENVNLYGSVTDTTSQVNILMGFLPNEENFKIGMKYIVARTSEYQYRLYYASDLSVNPIYYIDYSRYNIGNYSYEWRVTRGTTTQPIITTNNYTYVSNTPGGIYKAPESYFKDNIIVWLLPVITICIIFFTFKPAKGVRL